MTAAIRKLARGSHLMVAMISALFVGAFYFVAIHRLSYLQELNWIESNILVMIHKILKGEEVYAAPSMSYVPLIYPPGFAFASAPLSWILGEGFMAPRLLSILSLSGIFIVLGYLVYRESRDLVAAFIPAGIVAALYPVSGFVYDMARTDSFSMFLVIVAACLIRFKPQQRSLVVAALALCGAVLTKQTALLPAASLGLWLLIEERRKGIFFTATFLITLLISHAFLQWTSDGWFFYYVYRVPAMGPRYWDLFRTFLHEEVLKQLGIALGLAVLALIALRRQGVLFYVLLLAGLFGATLLPRVKVGGDPNNLLPFISGVALCCGFTMGTLRNMEAWRWLLVGSLALVAFAFQQRRDPRRDLWDNDRALEQPIRRMKIFGALSGEIFAPCHLYEPIVSGKNTSAFWGAIVDVSYVEKEGEPSLRSQLGQQFLDKRYAAVVVTPDFFMKDLFPLTELNAGYRRLENADYQARQWKEPNWFEVYLPR